MPSRDERPVTLPESGSPANLADFGSSLAVIVTHPWGPLGGNMNNNVVLALVFWFQRLRITTLRFDFCGSQIGRGHQQGLYTRRFLPGTQPWFDLILLLFFRGYSQWNK